MLQKQNKLTDLIHKIIKEEEESRLFYDRLEKEIGDHKRLMLEKRKSFSLLRNK